MPILAKKKIIFSDEAHFDLGRYVNKQNCRIWGTEKPTHPKRVTVCCEFLTRGIIGPFFFENEQGETITVNGDRYRIMLDEFFSQKLKRRILTTFDFNRPTLRATQTKLHSMVCGLFLKKRFLYRGIIGPFFFENEREAITVNGDRFRIMLNEFLFTKIEEEDIGNIWFQQDGATCKQPKLHSMF